MLKLVTAQMCTFPVFPSGMDSLQLVMGEQKKKFTDIFKSGGNILGQCASKALK